MAIKKSASKTKTKVKQVFDQAKGQAKASLKLLESLEKETLAKAKTFVKVPIPGKAGAVTNEKLLAALKKIGVASADDVESLRLRIERLEAEVANLRSLRGASTIGENIPQA